MKYTGLYISIVSVTFFSIATNAAVKVTCPTYKQINSAFRHNQDCKADGYCAEKINGHSFQIVAKNCTSNCEFNGFQYLKSAFLNNNYLHCIYGPSSNIEWQSSSTYQIGQDCTLACSHENDNSCTASCKNKKEVYTPED